MQYLGWALLIGISIVFPIIGACILVLWAIQLINGD